MGKISVVIVDDHPFFREGVCLYFKKNEEIEITEEFSEGQELLQFLEKNHKKVDVVIMDLQMPGMDGREATRRICQQWSELKVLVLTSYGSWDKVHSLLNLGAAGYLLKDASPEELTAAIKAVQTGGTYFGNQVKEALLNKINYGDNQEENSEDNIEKNKAVRKEDNQKDKFSDLIEPLTDREVDILKLIGEGLGNSEIAERLYISSNTVKTHVSHIFQKLNVNSRTQAAFYALQKGLIKT